MARATGASTAEASRAEAVRPEGRTDGRRNEIRSIAVSVFARKGFANATVRDIAEAAGILSGSLYHHFESKDAMLEEHLHELFDELISGYSAVATADVDVPEAFRRLIVFGFTSVAKRHDEFTIFQNDFAYLAQIPRFAFLREGSLEVQRAWITVIQRGVDEGLFGPDLDVHLVFRITMGALLAAVRWFDPTGSLSPEEMGLRQADFFLHGLLGARSAPPPARAAVAAASKPTKATKPKR